MSRIPMLALAASLAACSPSPNADAVDTYAQIVALTYADALAEATKLDDAIGVFLATPDGSTLDDARDAWLDSREPYLQSEAFRFYDGPIDNPTDGPEGLLNAWPLDEAYIDYVVGDDESGIINDTTTDITAAELEGLNEQGADDNIATGYHAVEFLLWGQDLSETGPGDRPSTDYLSGELGTAANQDRRGTYLTTVSGLIVDHLGTLTDAWAEDGDNYRATFVADDANASIEKILTGMIVLSGFETGGERLQAALDSGDQEDEHSCFSDNTHRDMVGDVIGVQNVWRGSYTAVDGSGFTGTGIRDVVQALDADLADRVDARVDESVKLAEALQPPFDQEIASGNTEGRARVQALVDSLRDQETVLFEVFELLGLSVEIPE